MRTLKRDGSQYQLYSTDDPLQQSYLFQLFILLSNIYNNQQLAY